MYYETPMGLNNFGVRMSLINAQALLARLNSLRR